MAKKNLQRHGAAQKPRNVTLPLKVDRERKTSRELRFLLFFLVTRGDRAAAVRHFQRGGTGGKQVGPKGNLFTFATYVRAQGAT